MRDKKECITTYVQNPCIHGAAYRGLIHNYECFVFAGSIQSEQRIRTWRSRMDVSLYAAGSINCTLVVYTRARL